jgi:hypothetical protein
MDLPTALAILPTDQTTVHLMDLPTDLTQEAPPQETTILAVLSMDLPTLEAALPTTDLAIPLTTEILLSVLLAKLILTLIPEPLELLTHPSSPTNVNSLLFAMESPTTDVLLTLSFLPTEECNSLGALFQLTPMETCLLGVFARTLCVELPTTTKWLVSFLP